MTEFVPTHKITFIPSHGGERQIAFVALYEEAAGSGGPAYTAIEWESEILADWELQADGTWTFQGKAVPSNGTVEIETIG